MSYLPSDYYAKIRRQKFNHWLHKLEHKVRRVPRPGFVYDTENMRVVGRAVAPFLPNKKGMRYQNGELIPRHR